MSATNLRFGCCYHCYHSGNPAEAIFRLEGDYHAFLELFQKYVNPIVHLYGYCLLPTHFHLLLRIKDHQKISYVYPDQQMLAAQFKNLFRAYTTTINKKYDRSGSLFKAGPPREVPRDKKLICDLVAYIHLNPQIYGVVSDFRYWPFSSCYAYLCQDRRSMIAKELLLDPECHHRILTLQQTPRQRVMDWEGGQSGEDAGT